MRRPGPDEVQYAFAWDPLPHAQNPQRAVFAVRRPGVSPRNSVESGRHDAETIVGDAPLFENGLPMLANAHE
jgi:hypothetical protein